MIIPLCRKLTALACLLFLPVMNHGLVHAQTLEKLPVAYTVIAPTQATLWTAKELGLFAKQGSTSSWCSWSARRSRLPPWFPGKLRLFMPAPPPWSLATSKDPGPSWLPAEPIAFPTCFSSPMRSNE